MLHYDEEKKEQAQSITSSPAPSQKAVNSAGAVAHLPVWIQALGEHLPLRLQAQLIVSQPGDRYEQEAERVADQVMRKHRKTPAILDEEKQKRSTPMLKQKSDAQVAPHASPSVNQALNGGGQALDAETQASMEAHFGQDFSNVRVHVDGQAAQSAQAINARAYTVGKDVVFGDGQYQPGTSEGQRLLAHELTHVVQQGGGQVQAGPSFSWYSDPGNPYEHEADRIAQSIMDRSAEQRLMQQVRPHALQIQRQVMSDDTGVDDTDTVEEDGLIHDGDRAVSGEDVSIFGPGEQLALGELTETQIYFPTEIEGEHGATPTTPDAGTSPPTQTGNQGKHQEKPFITEIDVFLSPPRQHLVAHWSDDHEDRHVISSGRGRCGTKGNPCDEKGTQIGCTPVGDWTVSEQRGPSAKNQEGAAMAWFVGFDPTLPNRSGLGIHNSQEADGTPRSHGCIRVGKDGENSEAWKFARKINRGVIKGKTKVHIEGRAYTHPYSCPPKKGKKK